MLIKKINATLAGLATLFILLHVLFMDITYLFHYYNPVMKVLFSTPFMICTILHAFCSMVVIMINSDGTRLDLYTKQNVSTLLQRMTAIILIPFLPLHINTFSFLLNTSSEGKWGIFFLLMFSQVLFFGIIFTHIAVSFSKMLITFGWLSDPSKQKTIDKVVYVVCAIAFAFSSFSIILGELGAFRVPGGK